jgi:uncharacterized repeat protein (TIGR03803 family)
MDQSGTLYGSVNEGGAYNHGAIYELTSNTGGTGWTYTVLHSFCPPGPICVDGGSPYGRLTIDKSGNLYGTTPSGGAHGGGTVFELSPNATRTVWTLTTLYNFGSQSHDGTGSRGGLVMDPVSGRLYGTTMSGGTYGEGTVFELTPPSSTGNTWMESVVYSLGANGGANDGTGPYAALIMDKSGKLYGTTYAGGLYRQGTVFALTPPSGTQTTWTEAILYDFCALAKCADGAEPAASLLMDAAGNLYGTTYRGGVSNISSNCGTVFELIPNGGKTPWKETVLYPFCSKPVLSDGGAPWAEVIMDGAGNLYGTTIAGGRNPNDGTIFKLTPPSAGKTAWTETVLYSFCSDAQGAACYDGQAPHAGLMMDKSGILYGTTKAGGLHSGGTVFEYH